VASLSHTRRPRAAEMACVARIRARIHIRPRERWRVWGCDPPPGDVAPGRTRVSAESLGPEGLIRT
jgi:hypothetical protein